MKKYNKLILWGIILSLSIPIIGLCIEKAEKRDLLTGILDETGAEFLEGDVDIGGAIIDRFMDIDEMLEIAYEIKERLGLEENYHLEDIEDEGFAQLTIQGSDNYNNFVTIILSSYEDMETNGETSLFINFIKREQFVEFNDIIRKAENIFERYNKPVDVATCIVGAFDGYIPLDEKARDMLRIIKLIRGKIVEQYADEDILSFSVFTPYIDEHIYTGNRKMNLNIAIRYNEYENKTYIWIGIPIITIGY